MSIAARRPRIALPAWRWSRGSLRSHSTVAIAAARDSLRIVAANGRSVDFWQQVPLPPDLLRKGWIAEPDAFGAALREVLHTCSLPANRLAWALPGDNAIGRLLSIRLAGVADPDALVAREASWVMSVNPEDYYLYWQRFADGTPDHVFVLALRKAVLDNLLRACTVAKARTVAIDLRALALALAVGEPDAVLANVEPDSLDVVILARGMPVAMRSLYLGSDADAGATGSKLIEELALALRLHDETNPASPLDPATPIFVTGDLCDGDLARRVAFVTKHPTVQPESPLPCPPGFPIARFMVNLGLLLKKR